jgi:hypothetical protein
MLSLSDSNLLCHFASCNCVVTVSLLTPVISLSDCPETNETTLRMRFFTCLVPYGMKQNLRLEPGTNKNLSFPYEYEYESVSKSFRTGRLERELQMEQLSAIRCSCTAILWVSVVSFAAIILCVAFNEQYQRYAYTALSTQSGNFLDTPSYLSSNISPLQLATGIAFYCSVSRKTPTLKDYSKCQTVVNYTL